MPTDIRARLSGRERASGIIGVASRCFMRRSWHCLCVTCAWLIWLIALHLDTVLAKQVESASTDVISVQEAIARSQQCVYDDCPVKIEAKDEPDASPKGFRAGHS